MAYVRQKGSKGKTPQLWPVSIVFQVSQVAEKVDEETVYENQDDTEELL